MRNLNLSNAIKVTPVMNAVSAGTGDTQSGSIIDMQGFDGVIFVAQLGTVTSGGVATLGVQSNTANSTSGMATLTAPVATAYTDVGGANSNGVIIADCYRPQKRYLRPQLTRATANIVINNIYAIQYTARTEPVTQPTNVLGTQLYIDQ